MDDSVVSASDVDRSIITSGSYHLIEADTFQAVKVGRRPSRALLIIYAVIGLGLLVLVLVGPFYVKVEVGCAFVGGVVGETLLRQVIDPMRQRRSYRRNKLLHDEFHIEVSDRDIRIFSANIDVTLTADGVVRWKDGKDRILIYVRRHIYNVVPKRLAENSFSLEILRERLRQYAGPAAI